MVGRRGVRAFMLFGGSFFFSRRRPSCPVRRFSQEFRKIPYIETNLGGFFLGRYLAEKPEDWTRLRFGIYPKTQIYTHTYIHSSHLNQSNSFFLNIIQNPEHRSRRIWLSGTGVTSRRRDAFSGKGGFGIGIGVSRVWSVGA